MQQWDVVVVITALTGLFAAIIAPIVKLTRAITRLTVTMESMEKDVIGLTASNSASHQRIWTHENGQDIILSDHENRIRVMEGER